MEYEHSEQMTWTKQLRPRSVFSLGIAKIVYRSSNLPNAWYVDFPPALDLDRLKNLVQFISDVIREAEEKGLG